MKFLLVLVLFIFNFDLLSEEISQPEKVSIGIYLNRIDEINLKENYFIADFYLWFRWKDKELKPYESFGIVDGDIESKGVVDTKELAENTQYACLKVKAKIHKQWDVKRYPLDLHQLTIKIEDENNELESLQYVPDTINSKNSNNRFVSGFKLSELNTLASTNLYVTNYGDTSLQTGAESKYSQAQFFVTASGGTIIDVVKVFWGLFMSVLVASLAFLIKPNNLDPRFGVSIGAIFAAAASGIIISDTLPPTSDFVMADKINMMTLLTIFLITLASAINLRIYESGEHRTAAKIDKFLLIMFPVIYFGLILYFII